MDTPEASTPAPGEPAEETVLLQIEGQGLSPQTFDIGELGPLLERLRTALTKFGGQTRRGKNDPAEVVLQTVTEGSVQLGFALKTPRSVVAWKNTANAVRTGKPGSHAEFAALTDLKKVLKIGRRAVFVMPEKWGIPNAVLSRTSSLIAPGTTQAETSIFGYCVSLGGDKPAAVIEISGKKTRVDLTEDLAKKLTVYNYVSVDGTAVLDAKNKEILSFTGAAVRPMHKKVGALKRLAAAMAPHLNGIDPDAFHTEQRGDT